NRRWQLSVLIDVETSIFSSLQSSSWALCTFSPDGWLKRWRRYPDSQPRECLASIWLMERQRPGCTSGRDGETRRRRQDYQPTQRESGDAAFAKSWWKKHPPGDRPRD